MKHKHPIAAIVLLCIFAALAISGMLHKSGTCDEIAHHIPAGVVFLTKGDLKMDTSQPPLARYIIAAPVVFFMHPNFPKDTQGWRREDRSTFGRDLFFKYNHQPRKMLFIGRIPILFIGVLCGIAVFIWAYKLYGANAALLSLLLYSFSPEILTHSSLATTDMLAAFSIFLSIYTFWIFLKNPRAGNLILCALTLGLAQLSKYSAIIIYPVYLMLYAMFVARKETAKGKEVFLKVLVIFSISIIVIWAGYGFKVEPILKNTMRVEEKVQFATAAAKNIIPFWNNAMNAKLESLLFNLPLPLGEHSLGIMGVLRHSEQGHTTYFMGQWSTHGNILYFIVAFLIKTPIPVLILLCLGLFTFCYRRPLTGEYFLILPALVYFIAALFGNLQVGIRHILPVYPFCLVLAARSIYILKHRLFKMLIALCCVVLIFNTIKIWPDYLSYFNEFAGGQDNGWKYLRDSNIDWGQDLPALAKYLSENNIDEVKLQYFGEDSARVYGIKFKKLDESELLKPKIGNVYAVSVQYLDYVQWTKEYSPATKAGYSIFIYDFRK